MNTALFLLLAQGLFGAFDTLYYHEWRARLPGGLPGTSEELLLHGARDLVYAVLFASLPFVRYEGAWAFALAGMLACEILITLRDFVVEDRVRRPLGGVFPGERITHAAMGILYGAFLSCLVPELLVGIGQPTALLPWQAAAPLQLLLPLMAFGVFASGVRDLGAVFGPRWMRYPWGHEAEPPFNAPEHHPAS